VYTGPVSAPSVDAHLEFDLEIDSMERVELSMALEEQIRAPVDEARLAEVDHVRDLMELVAEREGDEGRRTAHAVTDPENILDPEDLGWAEPGGRARDLFVSPLYTAGSAIMRLFFRVRVKGLENVPEAGPFVLLPNHVSLLDAPILALALGRDRALGCFWAGSSKLLLRNTLTRGFSRTGP
jgi:long-chain acyl-CoA synthetase